jgi:hypothetical protein
MGHKGDVPWSQARCGGRRRHAYLKNKVTWVRDDFVGLWAVARRIDDAAGGQAGQFDGQAVLEPEAEQDLVYAEAGSLQMGAGPAMTATRTYRWHFVGDRVEVFFADGRPFHGFRPADGDVEAKHLCGADLYRVRYEFGAWPVWTARWEVRGPRKDYAMVTQYRRVSGL